MRGRNTLAGFRRRIWCSQALVQRPLTIGSTGPPAGRVASRGSEWTPRAGHLRCQTPTEPNAATWTPRTLFVIKCKVPMTQELSRLKIGSCIARPSICTQVHALPQVVAFIFIVASTFNWLHRHYSQQSPALLGQSVLIHITIK